MPLALSSFETVGDAEAALRAAATARYLGGGTLVVRAANEGDLSIETFVRSTDPRLRAIEVADGVATVGAAATMAEIARHADLAALAPAARAIGGPAVRNMATVGGNLFAPAPYGDFAVALLALGASVEIDGAWREIDAFLPDRERIGGIVTAVRFALPESGAFRFAKVSRVRPKGVSVLSIGALIGCDDAGRVASARVALGCMANRPMRALAAERALAGAELTAEGIAAAVAAIGEGTAPITDPVASAWYRAEVLPVHFRRLLAG